VLKITRNIYSPENNAEPYSPKLRRKGFKRKFQRKFQRLKRYEDSSLKKNQDSTMADSMIQDISRTNINTSQMQFLDDDQDVLMH